MIKRFDLSYAHLDQSKHWKKVQLKQVSIILMLLYQNMLISEKIKLFDTLEALH